MILRLCGHSPAGGGRVGWRRDSIVCNKTRDSEAVLDLPQVVFDSRYGVAGAACQHVSVVDSFELARRACLRSSIKLGGRQG